MRGVGSMRLRSVTAAALAAMCCLCLSPPSAHADIIEVTFAGTISIGAASVEPTTPGGLHLVRLDGFHYQAIYDFDTSLATFSSSSTVVQLQRGLTSAAIEIEGLGRFPIFLGFGSPLPPLLIAEITGDAISFQALLGSPYECGCDFVYLHARISAPLGAIPFSVTTPFTYTGSSGTGEFQNGTCPHPNAPCGRFGTESVSLVNLSAVSVPAPTVGSGFSAILFAAMLGLLWRSAKPANKDRSRPFNILISFQRDRDAHRIAG